MLSPTNRDHDRRRHHNLSRWGMTMADVKQAALKVLGRQTSGNVQKVLWMLEEIGIAYTREDYGRQFNNTLAAEYRALNPTSKVPTLIDGKTSIWESNTI